MRRHIAPEPPSRPAISPSTRAPLRLLQRHIAACTNCPSMNPWRQFAVEAYGTERTGYLLVGEAPGLVSLERGRRFTGPAGQLIRRALRQVGHPQYADLEDLFYITDMVKCHPASRAKGSANRSPTGLEVRTCAGYLAQELAVLKPRVVVAFGKMAAKAVAEAVGQDGRFKKGEVRIMAFPHPSPRNRRTILTRYPSMAAFETAIAEAFRRLIAGLEG